MVEVQNWKAYASGSMVGFFDLALPGGVVVTGCKAFQKEDRLWFAFPSERVPDKNGGDDKWRDIVMAAEPTMRHLQTLVRAQLRGLLNGNAGGSQPRQHSPGHGRSGEHGDRAYQESRLAAGAADDIPF